MQDLSHLSNHEILNIYHANNNPKGLGNLPNMQMAIQLFCIIKSKII